MNINRLFDNHPGMRRADVAVRTHCLKQLPALRDLFWLQGHLTEVDHDDHEIPETEEQKTKRAQGRRLKMDSLAGWKSRMTWGNHVGTTSFRQQQKKEADDIAKAAEERKRITDLELKNIEVFKEGRGLLPRTFQGNYKESMSLT